MLLTDSDIVTSADLLAVESEVQAVSATTNPPILLEGSGSICELTWMECQQRILASMQSYTGYLGGAGLATHNRAVLNVGLPATSMPRVRLNQIVASDNLYGASQSSLKQWMVYCALGLFYRNASSRLGKDRLEEKYQRYTTDSAARWRALRSTGLPMVYQPMECPGAKHAFNPGTWSVSNLSLAAGSGTAQTVQVAITYYDSSLYVSEASAGNAESGPSQILSFAITAGKVLKIDITSLKPPAGVADAVGVSQGIVSPLNATHWNVWVGSPNGPLYLQTAAGVAIATKTYTLAGDPVLSGYTVQQGQYPLQNLSFASIISRS